MSPGLLKAGPCDILPPMNDLRVYDRISEAVGWTPMVRLRRTLGEFDCEAFAKIEFMNPMGSVKDRIARFMVEKALRDGTVHSGDVVVENSSGNTAMGLAMMAVLHDLRCKMVVRRQTSPEKLDCLRAMGVELVLVDGSLPPDHPESYNQKARQVVAETPKVVLETPAKVETPVVVETPTKLESPAPVSEVPVQK